MGKPAAKPRMGRPPGEPHGVVKVPISGIDRARRIVAALARVEDREPTLGNVVARGLALLEQELRENGVRLPVRVPRLKTGPKAATRQVLDLPPEPKRPTKLTPHGR